MTTTPTPDEYGEGEPVPTPTELEERLDRAIKRWALMALVTLLVLVAADLGSNAYYGWVAHANDNRARRADKRSVDAIDERNKQFHEHRLRSEEHAACTDAKIDELRTDIAALVTGKLPPADFPPASLIACKPAPFAAPSVEELLHGTTTTSTTTRSPDR